LAGGIIGSTGETVPLSGAAMFRFPHHLDTPVTIRVPHKESQTIQPIQQLYWIGS
jgi:hypothetical protein